MKKTFLLTILAVLALAVNAQQLAVQPVQKAPMQKAPAAELMEFGYCGEPATDLGFKEALTYRMLIEIPAEKAAKFEGAEIKKVTFALGSLTNTQAKVVIVNQKEDVATVYSQNASVQANAWNEVTLTTPYTIGTKGFFIGVQVDAQAADYPISVDAGPANPLGDWIGYQNGNAFEYMHAGDAGFGNNCIYIYLAGASLPQYDFALQAVNAKDFVKTGSEFTLGATVKNMGQQNVSSYDVTYQIDDQAPVTKTINTPLNAGQTSTINLDNLKFDQEGTYNITVTVSNLDGQADEDSRDNTLSKTVTAANDFIARKVLLEQFTGQSCGNCPRVHDFMEAALEDRNDAVWVVHHAGYYADNFTIEESEQYTWFYGGGGKYAPAAMFDRTNLVSQGAYTNGANVPVFMPTSTEEVDKLIDYLAAEPAVVDVNIKDGFNPETREYSVTVSGKAIGEFSREVYLHIFLTEDGLTGYQAGGGNNYTFNHTMRKVMTSTWGDEVHFVNGEYWTNYKCTLDNSWDVENMHVVAFLAYNSDTDVNDCVVLNTEAKDINTEDTAIEGVNSDKNNVWAVGNEICINGAYNEAAVYTVDGRLVAVANKGNVKVENDGLYLVVVDGVSYKVVVK